MERRFIEEEPTAVRVDEIDWRAALPFTNLFGCFNMAVDPGKLLTALLLVVTLFVWGRSLDGIFGANVYPGEREHYADILAHGADPGARPKPASMDQWRQQRHKQHVQLLKQMLSGDVVDMPQGVLELSVEQKSIDRLEKRPRPYGAAIAQINNAFDDQREEHADEPDKIAHLIEDRAHLIERIRRMQPSGAFEAAMHHKLALLNELVVAAVNLNLGLGALMPHGDGPVAADSSVVGVSRKLVVDMPCWLFTNHKWFVVAYGIGAFFLWACLGGALTRMAAVHATRDDRASFAEALRFGIRRWFAFVIAPVAPLLLVLLIIGLLIAGGWVMNLWVVDVLGALFFPLALIAGLCATFIVILLAASINQLYPAIAVESTDAFDAISRAFGYVRGKPWRTILYNGVALLYGSITYLFLSVVVYFTLMFTRSAVALGYYRSPNGVDQFDAIMPDPAVGNLLPSVDWHMLDWSGKVAGCLIQMWVWLVVALLVAFGISFYTSAGTWVYLLLRRAADGTELGDLYVEGPPPDEGPGEPQAMAPAESEGSPPAGDGGA